MRLPIKLLMRFTPLSTEIGYNCKHFFDNLVNQTSLMDTIHSEINNFPSIAKDWEFKRDNTKWMLKQQAFAIKYD
ncbi:MAG: hypothetical protein ACLTGQ_10895 [Mediterraneibacter gnavus]